MGPHWPKRRYVAYTCTQHSQDTTMPPARFKPADPYLRPRGNWYRYLNIYLCMLMWRPRRRWVDNVRTDFQEVGCVYMDWIGLAQDREKWQTLVSAVMNLRVPWNAGNFLTSCKPVRFSRMTLHHGVNKYSRCFPWYFHSCSISSNPWLVINACNISK